MSKWLNNTLTFGLLVTIAAASSACSLLGDDSKLIPSQDSDLDVSWDQEPDISPENPQIDVIMWGGWGQYDNFSVTPDGKFIQRFTYGIPEVSYQLSESELDSLYLFFSGFRGFDVWYTGGCADGDVYEITVKNKFFEHTVIADCIYGHPWLVEGSVEWRLNLLIGELLRLAKKTVQQSAPWIGLIGVPSLDKNSYVFKDSVQIRYELFNPTSTERTIFLIAADVFTVTVTGPNTYTGLGWGGVFCPHIPDDVCTAPAIPVGPGRSHVLSNKF
ncbi:MAG: hypothetical protein IIA50_04435, partial [Bacteroidetes bacterium]|nr:hypothetical protein [Bacteroidota bacterium]